MRIYRAWKRLARRWGELVGALAMSLIYLLIVPLFLFLRLRDPLQLRNTRATSYWGDWPYGEESLEDFFRMS